MKGKTTAAGTPGPTDEQIIRALAEFEGYTDLVLADIGPVDNKSVYRWHGREAGGQDWRIKTPDYLNNLNAMHRIEWLLERRELKDEYIDALGPFAEPDYNGPLGYDMWLLMHATARQRALAAYRTITEQEGKGQ